VPHTPTSTGAPLASSVAVACAAARGCRRCLRARRTSRCGERTPGADVFDPLAAGFTGMLVLRKSVQRHALVGDLLGPVGALHCAQERDAASWGSVARRREGMPSSKTCRTGAEKPSAVLAAQVVQSHAVCVDHWIGRFLPRLGLRPSGSGAGMRPRAEAPWRRRGAVWGRDALALHRSTRVGMGRGSMTSGPWHDRVLMGINTIHGTRIPPSPPASGPGARR
jgi:hypothetical protein